MGPRPSTTDPLAAAKADLDLLEAGEPGSPQDQVEIFGRIHAGLAAALAGAAPERTGPSGPAPGR